MYNQLLVHAMANVVGQELIESRARQNGLVVGSKRTGEAPSAIGSAFVRMGRILHRESAPGLNP